LPAGAISIEMVILGGRSGGQDRRYDIVLLDMTTGDTTQNSTPDEYHLDHNVSVDRKLITYLRATYDRDGKGVFDILVISNVNGQIQKEIPWDEKWADVLTWTKDQSLLIAYNDPEMESGEN
jgi:hypothetical protein